ncbi:MAG TPA: GWxTD domain-containing protein [Rhodothermales bacterium]|nr:GWxTD domain-containing protein [Rhodothermales bacterium]
MVRTYRRHHTAAVLLELLLLVYWAVPGVFAQALRPQFQVDVVSVRASETARNTRVDVYTRVPGRGLQFVSVGGAFKASYDVTATFYAVDENGQQRKLVETESWSHSVSTPSFAATQSSELADQALGSVALAPGRYVVSVRVEDKETGQSSVQEVPVNVRSLNRPVAVSDLILISAYDARQNAITPIIGATVPTSQPSFKLFYEIYARQPERVRVVREVVRTHQGGSARSLRTIFGLLGSGNETDDVAYTRQEATSLKPGRTPYVVEIPMGKLQAGDYLLRVRVEDEQGNVLDSAEKMITAEWSGLADHIANVDQAIDQLKYIAKDKDLAYIRAGRNGQERLSRFDAFWKKRDPTPGTDRNERMEEYYYRITYANRRFLNPGGGWNTDRGQVLVLFGEPDRVDRHTDDFQVKPYEVWYYQRIGKKFIFVDNSGHGDFHLLIPIWDERNRLR